MRHDISLKRALPAPYIALAVLFFLMPAALTAGEPQTAPTTAPSEPPPADKISVTQQQIAIGDRTLRYSATAGTLLMKDEAGKPKADVFFTAYEVQPPADAAARPITFVFNGGPGAASVWLHLGTVGPRRVKLDEVGHAPAPPYALVDNPDTWLDATDLVFIDPVGTGFSRPAAGEKTEQFYGVEEDIQWVADFIRLYTTRYNRWPSPKFLAGESYGTTRAAGLSEFLLDRYGIGLNGIVLISSVLDFQTISFGQGNDLPYVMYLPSYAAIAWYHRKLPEDLQADLPKTLKQVEQWAVRDYASALLRGDSLSADEAAEINKRLARYTGLDLSLVRKSRMRIDPGVFRKALLEGSRQVLGRFDARLTGYDPEPLSRNPDYDPSLSPFLAAYSATLNDYVRRSLKFESDLPYEALSGKVQPWNFGRSGTGYLNVAENLRGAMLKNPSLKVLFACGYYDLATPYLATRYTIDHLNVGDTMRGNVSQTFYDGGHMMYHHAASAKKLHDDAVAFIRGAAEKPRS